MATPMYAEVDSGVKRFRAYLYSSDPTTECRAYNYGSGELLGTTADPMPLQDRYIYLYDLEVVEDKRQF